jgi:nicotinamidase-related amidase
MAMSGLEFGPLGKGCLHICVDMQVLFSGDSEWATPWIDRVLPKVEEIVRRHPSETVFTRFIPAQHPGDGVGTWRGYYQRWASMTIDNLGREKLGLLPSLEVYCPPARIVDKWVYSPWTEGRLDKLLAGAEINSLIITGAETDVCVLATALGAIDRGYRVVLVTDAICSSTDETHDALMTLYHRRFSMQVETVLMETVLENWN